MNGILDDHLFAYAFTARHPPRLLGGQLPHDAGLRGRLRRGRRAAGEDEGGENDKLRDLHCDFSVARAGHF